MSRLPSGYQELTHIESTGTQYIDTGIAANVDANSYQIKFTDFVYSSLSSVFGSSNNWCDTLSYYNNTLRYCLPSSALTTGSIFSLSNYAGGTFTVSKNGVINDSGYTFTSTSDNNSYGGNILAFSGKGKASVKIHFFKIFVNNILVRNLIPCKRLSDSAIGMYDLVSNTFFGNSGTGTFIAGTPVLDPIVPTWGSGLASVNKSAIIRRRGLIGADKILKLYWDGDECTDVTGGWTAYPYHFEGNNLNSITPQLTKNADSMTIHIEDSTKLTNGTVFSDNIIDMSGYNKLKIHIQYGICKSTNTTYTASSISQIATQKINNYHVLELVHFLVAKNTTNTISDYTVELDCSQVSNGYIAILVNSFRGIGYTAYTTLVIDKIWLEK